MKQNSELAEFLGCAAVAAVVAAGSAWFYLNVMCSAQHLLAETRSRGGNDDPSALVAGELGASGAQREPIRIAVRERRTK